MGREQCMMCHFLGDTQFCSYYDIGYNRCEDVVVCPDGLDDDIEEMDEEQEFETED